MEAASRFYQALGLPVEYAMRPTRDGQVMWAELRADQGSLALHHTAPDATEPDVELSFASDEPLEKVVERLARAGYEPNTAIVDESFGRSFTVRDPEGMLIQINEHDRELST
jgi:uncharacterized glyoxalase superfamily protein PhnB